MYRTEVETAGVREWRGSERKGLDEARVRETEGGGRQERMGEEGRGRRPREIRKGKQSRGGVGRKFGAARLGSRGETERGKKNEENECRLPGRKR